MLFNADLSPLNAEERMHALIAFGLWCRSLRASQGAILLLERGMVPEAQVMVRTAFEFLVYAAAGMVDPEIVESMVTGDSYARREMARSMLDEGVKCGRLTADQIVSLEELVVEHAAGKRQISVYDAANKVGLAYHYSTVYRALSLVGAHATVASTNSVFDPKEVGFGAVFGPSDVGLEFCLGLVELCIEEGLKRFKALLTN
jgi:Family of unknown function (DUF5677)